MSMKHLERDRAVSALISFPDAPRVCAHFIACKLNQASPQEEGQLLKGSPADCVTLDMSPGNRV